MFDIVDECAADVELDIRIKSKLGNGSRVRRTYEEALMLELDLEEVNYG